jgi:DegV family protein with EDD domain
VRSALTAREAFPDADIRVMDTRMIGGPLAAMVLEAERAARCGASAGEVEGLVRGMMPRARLYFLVETLEFLQRGGRIGGAAALVGTLLQIKPILTFAGGRVDQFGKERTQRRALARLRQLPLAEAAPGKDGHVTVMHVTALDRAKELAASLQAVLATDPIMIMDLPPAIATYSGPGALAVGYFTKAEQSV